MLCLYCLLLIQQLSPVTWIKQAPDKKECRARREKSQCNLSGFRCVGGKWRFVSPQRHVSLVTNARSQALLAWNIFLSPYSVKTV